MQRVTLRLVGDDERDAFDRTLEEHHYLANARLAGQTLRYVAQLDGHWVALLTFSAATLHLKGREHWSAIENGGHYRRDVSFGEDANGVSPRGAAQVLACLRNLALGVYELARERERTGAPSARSRCRQMTFAAALAELRR